MRTLEQLSDQLIRSVSSLVEPLRVRLETHSLRFALLERRIGLGQLAYKGVWTADAEYKAGACVTRDGSAWIAQRDTQDRPGTSDAWKMAVRKGDAGKRGQTGPMPRHRWAGTRLQFQQGPSGDEWGSEVDLKGPRGEPGQTGVIHVAAPAAETRNSYFPAGW